MTLPTLDVELELLESASVVIGIDEVGRGAVAGPVVVGAAAVVPGMPQWPAGLRDSKRLTEKRREQIGPLLRDWTTVGLGWVDADQIDEHGITWALAQAAASAVADLAGAGVDLARSHVLLDGSHDWLSPAMPAPIPVTMREKSDRDCVSVAAAACCAKVARDAYMRDAAALDSRFGWEQNKGYGTAAHLAAVREHGVSPLHRQTWLTRTLS